MKEEAPLEFLLYSQKVVAPREEEEDGRILKLFIN
jgi:hypothetical protein